jgi:hypothetical protein
VNLNATWSISLESYYLYLEPQEVSKAPTTSSIYSSLLKSAKSHFGCHCSLGVNYKNNCLFIQKKDNVESSEMDTIILEGNPSKKGT